MAALRRTLDKVIHEIRECGCAETAEEADARAHQLGRVRDARASRPQSQTLLVEIRGAGRALERRDRALDAVTHDLDSSRA